MAHEMLTGIMPCCQGISDSRRIKALLSNDKVAATFRATATCPKPARIGLAFLDFCPEPFGDLSRQMWQGSMFHFISGALILMVPPFFSAQFIISSFQSRPISGTFGRKASTASVTTAVTWLT